jgi:K+-transporting ATPase KdpF subunit
VGRRICCGKHTLLRDCDWVRNGLRTIGDKGETGMIETLLLGLVTVLLLAYLVYALLHPERF